MEAEARRPIRLSRFFHSRSSPGHVRGASSASTGARRRSCIARVVAVTREPDGSLALDGRRCPVDWVVEMARFDQEGLFDRLAAKGTLDLGADASAGRPRSRASIRRPSLGVTMAGNRAWHGSSTATRLDSTSRVPAFSTEALCATRDERIAPRPRARRRRCSMPVDATGAFASATATSTCATSS